MEVWATFAWVEGSKRRLTRKLRGLERRGKAMESSEKNGRNYFGYFSLRSKFWPSWTKNCQNFEFFCDWRINHFENLHYLEKLYYWPHFHGHLKPSLSRSVVCSKLRPISMGTLKPPTAAQWCDQAYAAHRNTRNPRSAVRAGRRNTNLTAVWAEQTKPLTDIFTGQSPRSGFAVIGPFEPMPAGTGIAPPRCHPPPDGGTLRHVNNSLPGPFSEGSVHGNGSRQPDNWR